MVILIAFFFGAHIALDTIDFHFNKDRTVKVLREIKSIDPDFIGRGLGEPEGVIYKVSRHAGLQDRFWVEGTVLLPGK